MIRRLFISLGCLVAGLAAGFLMRARNLPQAAENSPVAAAKAPAADTRPVTAALSASGRRVLAWLGTGLPQPDHFMEMPELSLEDLKNVEALSGADFPVLLPHASDFRRQRLLMERWAEVDARAFAAWLGPLARLYDPGIGWFFSGHMSAPGSPLFHAGVRALSRTDPDAAKELNRKDGGMILEFLPASPRVAMFPSVPPSPPPPPPDPEFTAMSGGDAWRWLKEHRRTNDLSRIAEALTKSDPERAVAWLEEIPPIYERTSLLKLALLAATRDNAERLLTVLGKFAAAEDVIYALKSCQKLNAGHDPRIEEWARQCTDAGTRRAVFQWLADRRAVRGVEDAMAWLEQLPPGADRGAAMEKVATRCPNPAEMARKIAAEATIPGEGRALTILTTQWAQKEHAEALTWAQSLPPGPLRAQAIAGVWAAWTHTDPEAALASVVSLPDTDRRAGTQAVASSWWARQYPGKALQWIATLPAADQPSALAATATDFPNSLNGEALTALTRLAGASAPPEDVPAFLRFARRTVSREIRRDAEAAARWATALPQGEVRREALSTVAEHLLSESWEKGSAWVESLPAADQSALRQ